MRKLFLFLVMVVASLGVIGLAPPRVEAFPRYSVGYYYRPPYYGPVYPTPVYPTYYHRSAYYPTYYPAYYPTYTSSYYVAPAYRSYYGPAPIVVSPRPMVRGYVAFPGGYVSW